MVDLTVSFRCSAEAEKKAVYILNLFASVSGIRFKRTDEDGDIAYGDGSGRLNIPCIDYEFNHNEWNLFSDRTRLVLPGFIQPRSVKVADSKLGVDIFYLAFEFLRAGLDNQRELKWSPNRIRTNLRYIYPFFDSFVNLFVQSLKEAYLLPDAFEKTSPWPQGASFALGLSHDLDILRRKLPGGAAMLVKSAFSNSVPGGVGGSEGAVVLSVEGEESRVEQAFTLLKEIKGEPPVAVPDTLSVRSPAEHNYNPNSQLAAL